MLATCFVCYFHYELISHRFPLDEAPMAFRAARTTERMKVVLTMGLSGQDVVLPRGPNAPSDARPPRTQSALPFRLRLM